MRRLILSIAFVFPLICLAIPSNLKAQDATCCVNWGVEWDSRGDYDKDIAEYNQALAICPTYKNRHCSSTWTRGP